jgi:hypothetical protein
MKNATRTNQFAQAKVVKQQIPNPKLQIGFYFNK